MDVITGIAEQFGFNPFSFFVYSTLFLVLWFLINKFVVKKLDVILEERTKVIQSGISKSEEADKRLNSVEADYEAKMTEFKKESKVLKDENLAQTKQEAKVIIENAQKEAADIIEKANERFASEKRKLEGKIDDQVIAKTRAVLDSILGSDIKIEDSKIEEIVKSL